ncbi:MAG TPA: hypothetical protein VFV33_25430, partial [Gemmatimonadaceae bacterium]|nr:hypothetical protein [Gemmatimonadaceae bacterium]
MSKSSRSTTITAENAAVETPRSHADRMFRAAQECIRQRQRYARLVDHGAHDDEQQGALRIACICDEVLAASATSYEAVTAAMSPHRDEEWWHKANSLWHAAREYSRRHRGCDQTSKKLTNHSPQ